MSLLYSHGELQRFQQRLLKALSNASVSSSASDVAREINLHTNDFQITVAGVDRWLKGQCFPSHQRLVVLAEWLHVPAQWLRYGTTASVESSSDFVPPDLEAYLLAEDMRSLDEHSKKLVRELVDQLMRAQHQRA